MIRIEIKDRATSFFPHFKDHHSALEWCNTFMGVICSISHKKSVRDQNEWGWLCDLFSCEYFLLCWHNIAMKITMYSYILRKVRHYRNLQMVDMYICDKIFSINFNFLAWDFLAICGEIVIITKYEMFFAIITCIYKCIRISTCTVCKSKQKQVYSPRLQSNSFEDCVQTLWKVCKGNWSQIMGEKAML